MSAVLYSIDPGAHALAFACFVDERLREVDMIRGENFPHGIDRFRGSLATCVPSAVIEVPQVYGRRRSPVDPNDLIAVAVTVGRAAQQFFAGRVDLVQPHTWKGSVPKDVMLNRIVSKLDDGERLILHSAKVPASLRHNLIDAVGLGLWKVRRL